MNPAKISRRTFLTRAGLAGGAAWTGYASLVEAHWLEIGRHEVNTNTPGGPVKLLHISDLHASWCVSLAYIKEALDLGRELKPDVICITGDFISRKYDAFDDYAGVLSSLTEVAPVFASLGNHDGGYWARRRGGYETTDHVRNLLQKSKIELLHNNSVDLQINGRALRLAGLGDWNAHEANPAPAFARSTPGPRPYSIVLSHNPDTKELLAPYPWDLMLSGHTHGGQVCLPLIGPPYVPVRDRRFIAGMHSWENRLIHVTKGVGNMYGIRFDCRPEISLITLA